MKVIKLNGYTCFDSDLTSDLNSNSLFNFNNVMLEHIASYNHTIVCI